MRIIFALFCLIIIISSPILISPVLAAPEADSEFKISLRALSVWKRSTDRMSDQYNDVLSDVYLNKKNFAPNVDLLHSYYSLTKQYQPIADPVLDEMSKYALIVEESSDRSEINTALLSYTSLLKSHLVNLNVLSFAITMSHIDVRFGDKYFLQKIRDILVSNLLSKPEYKGKRPENAYHIVTYGEETRILEEIGGVVNKSKVYQVRNKFYNVHDMTLKSGGYKQIYMDVTDPIKNSLHNNALRELEDKLSIPQQ